MTLIHLQISKINFRLYFCVHSHRSALCESFSQTTQNLIEEKVSCISIYAYSGPRLKTVSMASFSSEVRLAISKVCPKTDGFP